MKKRKICGSDRIPSPLLSHSWNLKLSNLLFSPQTLRLFSFRSLYFLRNQMKMTLMMMNLPLSMNNNSRNPNRQLKWHMMIYSIIHVKMNSTQTGLKANLLKKVEIQLFVSYPAPSVSLQWLIKGRYWKMRGNSGITLRMWNQYRM